TLRFSGKFDNTPYHAEQVITLLEESSLDIGDITMQPGGRFGFSNGNTIDAEPLEATPGSYVTVRGTYDNTKSGTVSDTAITFTLPSGMSYMNGSLILDGTPVEPTEVNEHEIVVELGTLNRNEYGDFQYRLNVDEDGDGHHASLNAMID